MIIMLGYIKDQEMLNASGGRRLGKEEVGYWGESMNLVKEIESHGVSDRLEIDPSHP